MFKKLIGYKYWFGKEKISEDELIMEIRASGCVQSDYCAELAKDLLKTLEIRKKNNY